MPATKSRFSITYLAGFGLIAVGAVLLFVFLQQIRPSSTTVYVPKNPIPAFQLFSKDALVPMTVISGEGSPGENALTEDELEKLTKGNKKMYSSVPLLKNERIDTRVIGANQVGSFAVVLPDEQVVSVKSSAAASLAGALRAGDIVDVIVDDTTVAMYAKVIAVGTSSDLGKQVAQAGTDPDADSTGDSLFILLAVPNNTVAAVAGKDVAFSLRTGCKLEANGTIVPRSKTSQCGIQTDAGDRMAATGVLPLADGADTMSTDEPDIPAADGSVTVPVDPAATTETSTTTAP